MVTLEKVRRDAPWAWIKGAIDDMRAAPFISIGYGAVFTIIGLLITVGLWSLGQGAVVPVTDGRHWRPCPIGQTATTVTDRSDGAGRRRARVRRTLRAPAGSPPGIWRSWADTTGAARRISKPGSSWQLG